MKQLSLLDQARFTLRSELAAVSSIKKIPSKEFLRAVEILSKVRGKIVVSGIGKSGQIAMKIASTMTSLGILSVYLNPAEAMHGDFGLVGQEDAILAISSSGETKELLRMIKHISRLGVPILSITGGSHSSLVKASTISLVFKIKDEGSPFNLAPMASTTASLVVGDMLAAALTSKIGFSKKDFANFHPGGSLGLRLAMVEELFDKKNPPIVREQDDFREALSQMSRTNKGIAAVINSRGMLVGAVSDGDIRRFLLSGKFSDTAAVRDLMTVRPKKVTKKESLEVALRKMETYKITSLFVTDARGRFEGIITMHDIVEYKIL